MIADTIPLSLTRRQKEDNGSTGLTSGEARSRLAKCGPNALPEPRAGSVAEDQPQTGTDCFQPPTRTQRYRQVRKFRRFVCRLSG
ncbi:hypothetical protein JVX98_31210 (plasmid) [Ensifer sp. PDNC004]|uniref:cation-transporting P-type ATPase n=1 Tax=Ensifer sp. PDNC004 TaxID=2811423 RepID=UPI001966270A|nr:hypothetical protein JVX98_31210 [Ensifer sp. PDNC004]